MDAILNVIFKISGFLWGWPVLVLLIGGGLFFTIKTKAVQFTMLKEAVNIIMEKPEKEGDVSAFGALMVSTASKVGTGNVIGVATAIAAGGPGALFWMWVTALVGGASAFVESCLAQIYKKKNPDGSSYGGPAYYIEAALHSRPFAIVFCVCLIVCYGVAFNMLAAYNMQSTFESYSFYSPSFALYFAIGLGLLCLYVLVGGGKRIVAVCEKLVPIMGVFYVAIAVLSIVLNIGNFGAMFAMIFKSAFDFKSIFGGFMGSCMVLGFKRGLFSNEAGIGSSPNAAASASTSHPAKQGLVQMFSVYLDTILLCTCTGFMCLISGVQGSEELSGAAYAQAALSATFGSIGTHFVTFALMLFAFTTLIGNFFFIENCFAYISRGKMGKTGYTVVRVIGAVIIAFGCVQKASVLWDFADFLNVLMAFINIPVCLVIGGIAYKCLDNYRAQRKEGKASNKVTFKAADIGVEGTDFWN